MMHLLTVAQDEWVTMAEGRSTYAFNVEVVFDLLGHVLSEGECTRTGAR
jgi:hypothetical protein